MRLDPRVGVSVAGAVAPIHDVAVHRVRPRIGHRAQRQAVRRAFIHIGRPADGDRRRDVVHLHAQGVGLVEVRAAQVGHVHGDVIGVWSVGVDVRLDPGREVGVAEAVAPMHGVAHDARPRAQRQAVLRTFIDVAVAADHHRRLDVVQEITIDVPGDLRVAQVGDRIQHGGPVTGIRDEIDEEQVGAGTAGQRVRVVVRKHRPAASIRRQYGGAIEAATDGTGDVTHAHRVATAREPLGHDLLEGGLIGIRGGVAGERGGAGDQDVVLGIAHDAVGTVTADEQIPGSAADEHIVPVAAEDDRIAGGLAGVDFVVAALTEDDGTGNHAARHRGHIIAIAQVDADLGDASGREDHVRPGVRVDLDLRTAAGLVLAHRDLIGQTRAVDVQGVAPDGVHTHGRRGPDRHRAQSHRGGTGAADFCFCHRGGNGVRAEGGVGVPTGQADQNHAGRFVPDGDPLPNHRVPVRIAAVTPVDRHEVRIGAGIRELDAARDGRATVIERDDRIRTDNDRRRHVVHRQREVGRGDAALVVVGRDRDGLGFVRPVRGHVGPTPSAGVRAGFRHGSDRGRDGDIDLGIRVGVRSGIGRRLTLVLGHVSLVGGERGGQQRPVFQSLGNLNHPLRPTGRNSTSPGSAPPSVPMGKDAVKKPVQHGRGEQHDAILPRLEGLLGPHIGTESNQRLCPR